MIAEATDRVITAHRQAREEERTGKKRYLRPSSLGQCERKAILEVLEEPTDEWDERQLRVFSVGSVFEEWVIRALKEDGILTATQVEVSDGFFKGYVDGIIVVDGVPRVLELKSVHSKAFWWAKKGDGGMPYDSHIHQAWAYTLMLKEWEGEALAAPVICYVSKDDLTISEYTIVRQGDVYIAYDELGNARREVMADTEEQMERLRGFLERKEIPPIPFGSPDEHSYLCMRRGRPNCPFYTRCWGATLCR